MPQSRSVPSIALAAALSLLHVLPAAAQTFANPSRGYTFQATPDWSLAHPDFMLVSRSGASLSESRLPPQGPLSLDRVSRTAGMIACIGADYEDTDERFGLDGSGWQGQVSVFVEPARAGRHRRHVLQLVARHGEDYRLFYLAVPSREWLADRKTATGLLATLRFD